MNHPSRRGNQPRRLAAVFFTMFKWLLFPQLSGLLPVPSRAVDPVPPVFPGNTWATLSPARAGMEEAALDAFIAAAGGNGCLVRHGYLIRSWGNPAAQGEWASASKPVLGTLLMLAVAEGRLPSPDATLQQHGVELRDHHHGITFRHLANMVSGYARAEDPGAAWAYNDTAINLYLHALQRIKGTGLEEAVARRLGTLQFEDGPVFGARDGTWVSASPRDFARLGWFWLRRGVWQDRPVIPQQVFDDFVQAAVPASLPRSTAGGEDYLGVGTYGGSSDQTEHGPGAYGAGFWFNEISPTTGNRVWPSLPPDAFQANGYWNKHTVTMIPSWGLVLAVRGGKMGRFEPGLPGSTSDRRFKLLRSALTDLPDSGP